MSDQNNSGWTKRHGVLARTGIIVVSCLIALVGAELLTRLVLPELSPTRKGRVKFWTYDERLGWAHQPNQLDRFKHPYFDIEVAINSDGLRDTEMTAAAESKRRMVVLGDSFGWGFGVEHGERFDTLLEQRRGWELINGSVSGYGTDQQYLWLADKGLDYKPEVVLLLLFQNDFTNNSAKEQYWYYKPHFSLQDGQLQLENTPVPPTSFSQRVSQFVMGRTYLYGYLYRTVIFPLNFRLIAARHAAKKEQGLLPERISPYEITGALLAAIKQLCDDNGIRFVLVSVPGEARYREFLSKFSSEQQIDYLALDDSFAAVDRAEYVIRRDNHWNAKGHELAADAIDRYLQQLGIF